MAKHSSMGRRLVRGAICWVTFPLPDGRRPALILTRTPAIGYLNSLTVAPLTTTIRDVPSQVLLLPEDDGVSIACSVNLYRLQTVMKDRFGSIITHLSDNRMRQVEHALLFALDVKTVS